MATLHQILMEFQTMPFAIPFALAAVSWLFLYYIRVSYFTNNNKSAYAKLPPVPVVPGLPVIGNLLQLKEKKPYKTFTSWAEEYGPIYSIRTGACTMVLLNSSQVAKEMITKAIVALNDRTGSSQYAITKFVEEKHKQLPQSFRKLLLLNLKKLVASGKLVKVKASFKLPPRSSSAAASANNPAVDYVAYAYTATSAAATSSAAPRIGY